MFDFRKVPEEQRVAFYGALFAMAEADGTLHPEEMALIYDALDLEGLSPESQVTVRDYMLKPPSFRDCLVVLAHGKDELRYGVMVNLVDMALADDVLEPSERAALDLARLALRITDPQVEAIKAFIKEVRRVRARGEDDEQAQQTLRKATAGLYAVGVPTAAVLFSGSVAGLGAAGITGGLAALGLGLGVVPGVGVAVLIGGCTYFTVSWLLGTKDRRRRKAEVQRAASCVAHLETALGLLNQRLAELEEDTDTDGGAESRVSALLQRRDAIAELLGKRRAKLGT